MFKKPFSFGGRIRRTEYGLSIVFYFVVFFVLLIVLDRITSVFDDSLSFMPLVMPLVLLICYVPMVWFLWAQGAKRCHDVGQSGWYQLIPFYVLYLLFAEGNPGANEYGVDPKNTVQEAS